MVQSLDQEHNKLMGYYQDLSNNLKVVHKNLIHEAESNKMLSVQKDQLFKNLQNLKEKILTKNYRFLKFLQKIERRFKETLLSMSNFQSKSDLNQIISELLKMPELKGDLSNLNFDFEETEQEPQGSELNTQPCHDNKNEQYQNELH